MNYRAEIDGLRALAVAPVILFHAGFDIFSGGFIGVDIFFVISGYLITTIIVSDIEKNRFSLLNFYERRARRILPALFVVMCASTFLAWMWMLPLQIHNFGLSVIFTTLFSSNFLFWQENGYFDTVSEEKPLLHTWSLAVEEQYYIIFPLFLLLFWKFGRERVFWIIVVSATISLIICEASSRNYPAANFYLLHTRAWELLAGSISALIILKKKICPNNAMSFVGLAAIIFSIFYYDKNTPFPSLYALLPVIGVVFLILFAQKDTIVGRFLSIRFLVGIGLISYSAYLWHQPLFAFSRIYNLKEPSTNLTLFLSLLSILLAYATWKFIEQPFRDRTLISKRAMMACVPAFFLIPTCLGVFAHLNDGYVGGRTNKSPNVEFLSLGEKSLKAGSVCSPKRVDKLKWTSECSFGDKNSKKQVVLIGDSHARALSYSLNETFLQKNIRGSFLTLKGCQTIPYIRRNKSTSVINCEDRFDEFLQHLSAKNSDVILVSRWTFRLYPIKGVIDKMPYINSEGFTEIETYREYDVYKNGKFYRDLKSKKNTVNKYVNKISNSSRLLFLIYPIPETGIDIEKHNRHFYNKTNKILKNLSINIEDYDKRNKFIVDIFDSIDKKNIVKIRPKSIFCDTFELGRCVLQHNGIPLYYDDDHLSKVGADLLVHKIQSLADWGE